MAEDGSRRATVRPDSVSKMSAKLLEGYAMLADSCPDCGVPLLRKPGGGDILCVNCSDSDEDGAAPPQLVRQAAQGVREASLTANGTVESHSSSDEEEEELLQAPPPLRQQLQNGTPPALRRTTLAPASDDHVSQRIADKMLEGWALLDQQCPRCQTPLVRSRQQRMYCAGCDMFVMREADAQQQQQQQQEQMRGIGPPTMPAPAAAVGRSQSEGGQATRADPAAPAVDAARCGAATPRSTPPAPAPATAAASAVAREKAAAPGRGMAAFNQPASISPDLTLPQKLETAAAAVGDRMQQASMELATASIQQAQALVQLIHSCADALTALQGCKRKLADS